MTGALFDVEDAEPRPDVPKAGDIGTPPAGLGQDALKTWRQRSLIAQGIHPVTRAAINADGGTCGDCRFLYLKSGDFAGAFWKCSLAASKTNHGPDIRKWWPACQSHRTAEAS